MRRSDYHGLKFIKVTGKKQDQFGTEKPKTKLLSKNTTKVVLKSLKAPKEKIRLMWH